jgi:hypothetical protein
MYANDNKGHFCAPTGTTPSWTNGLASARVDYVWSWVSPSSVRGGMLWPYVRSVAVFGCPNDPYFNGSSTSYGINTMLGTCAIVNGRLITDGPGTSPIPIMYTLGQIRHSERLFLFIETARIATRTQAFGAEIGGLYAPAVYPYIGVPSTYPPPGQLHFQGLGDQTPDGCTISFVDGHAIFWIYADDINTEWPNFDGPDYKQLAAWSGGAIPQGVTP